MARHSPQRERHPYDNDYCGIFVVRDGRIAEVREYLDTDYAARVLLPGAQA
jgi:ketosteroid isomerase-like protein